MSKKPSAGGKIQWTKMFRKLSPYTIRKGFRYMKHYGLKEFWIRLHERFEPKPQREEWICSCGAVNTGKFCSECGSPRPTGKWTCSCGAVNTGKFCAECGKPRQ